jgi:hypothetical protein
VTDDADEDVSEGSVVIETVALPLVPDGISGEDGIPQPVSKPVERAKTSRRSHRSAIYSLEIN